MSLLKGLSVVSVPVTDWAKAKAFYHDTLGLPILYDVGEEVGWCEFGEDGKTTFAISLWRDATPPVRGGTIAVFAVDDCAKATAELRRRGVKCADPVTYPDMVSYADFYDPEGNLLQIAQSLVPQQ